MFNQHKNSQYEFMLAIVMGSVRSLSQGVVQTVSPSLPVSCSQTCGCFPQPGLHDVVTLGKSRARGLELGLWEAAWRSCVNPIRSAWIKHSPFQSPLRANADPTPVRCCRETSALQSSYLSENFFLSLSFSFLCRYCLKLTDSVIFLLTYYLTICTGASLEVHG